MRGQDLKSSCTWGRGRHWQDLQEDSKGGEVSGWTLWSSQPPLKWKRCPEHNLQKRRNGGMPVGYSGSVALRREECGMYTCC
jgi:hypothetical protein